MTGKTPWRIISLLPQLIMQNQVSANWGFKQLTKNSIVFYHTSLAKYKHQIKYYLSSGYRLKENIDGSITIAASPALIKTITQEMIIFFNQIDENLSETSNYYYTVPSCVKPILKGLPLAFEGCIAIILMSDIQNSSWINRDWQFINSRIGGLFIEPFTLLFYTNYSKVIHPINAGNFYARDKIERTVATAVQRILQRIEEAQPGYEGLAMLSYVEEKTSMSRQEIVDIINQKSNQIQNPKYFPLLYF